MAVVAIPTVMQAAMVVGIMVVRAVVRAATVAV